MESKDLIELRKFCVEIAFRLSVNSPGDSAVKNLVDYANIIEDYLTND